MSTRKMLVSLSPLVFSLPPVPVWAPVKAELACPWLPFSASTHGLLTNHLALMIAENSKCFQKTSVGGPGSATGTYVTES